MLTVHIKFVSSKNIDNWLIYGLKSIKIGANAQIWSYCILLITQPILSNFDKSLNILYVHETSSCQYSTPKHGFEHF